MLPTASQVEKRGRLSVPKETFANKTAIELPEQVTLRRHNNYRDALGVAVRRAPRGLFFAVLGVVLLDFGCDACQSPSRAYLLVSTVYILYSFIFCVFFTLVNYLQCFRTVRTQCRSQTLARGEGWVKPFFGRRLVYKLFVKGDSPF